MLEKFNFQYLLVTRGANGMSLISKEQVSHHTVEKIRVYDVSGAGDTVISVLAVMLNNGHGIEEAVDIANEAGSCLLYTSPSPRDATLSRMPSSA